MFLRRLYLPYPRCGSFYAIRKFLTQSKRCLPRQVFKEYSSSQDDYSRFKNLSSFEEENSVEKQKMMAWQVNEAGLQNIRLSSAEIPTLLKPSDVLIKVTASSVNPLDVLMIDENYGVGALSFLRAFADYGGVIARPSYPLIVGRDFVGEVIRVGQSVTNVKVADKVWGVVLPHYQGAHAQYVVANSCVVCPKPDNVTDVEAASLPFVGLTGWQAAVYSAGLPPNGCRGEKVLIVGASGGVGSFLTQLLSIWGAKVVATCSESAFDLVLSCGATEVFDSKDPEVLEKIQSRWEFDVVFDAAGTDSSEWKKVIKTKPGIFGTHVTFKSPLLTYTDENGIVMGTFQTFGELLKQNSELLPEGKFLKWAFFFPNQKALEEIGKLLSQQKIRPIIDKVYKFEDGVAAYEHVQNGPRRGKVVLDMS